MWKFPGFKQKAEPIKYNYTYHDRLASEEVVITLVTQFTKTVAIRSLQKNYKEKQGSYKECIYHNLITVRPEAIYYDDLWNNYFMRWLKRQSDVEFIIDKLPNLAIRIICAIGSENAEWMKRNYIYSISEMFHMPEDKVKERLYEVPWLWLLPYLQDAWISEID